MRRFIFTLDFGIQTLMLLITCALVFPVLLGKDGNNPSEMVIVSGAIMIALGFFYISAIIHVITTFRSLKPIPLVRKLDFLASFIFLGAMMEDNFSDQQAMWGLVPLIIYYVITVWDYFRNSSSEISYRSN